MLFFFLNPYNPWGCCPWYRAKSWWVLLWSKSPIPPASDQFIFAWTWEEHWVFIFSCVKPPPPPPPGLCSLDFCRSVGCTFVPCFVHSSSRFPSKLLLKMVNVSSNQTSLQHFPDGIVLMLLLPSSHAVILLYGSKPFHRCSPAPFLVFTEELDKCLLNCLFMVHDFV